jgi:hypothetical protein
LIRNKLIIMPSEKQSLGTQFKTRVLPIIVGIIMAAWFFVIALSSD